MEHPKKGVGKVNWKVKTSFHYFSLEKELLGY